MRKVFELYNSLTDREREQVRQFIIMEESDSHSNILKLYNIIHSQSTQNEEKIWEHLFPQSNFNDNAIRKLFSKLTTHFENFLAYQGFCKDRHIKKIYLLEELNLRHPQHNLLVKSYKKLKKDIPTFKDSAHFRAQFLLETQFIHYLLKDGGSLKLLRAQREKQKQAFEQWLIHELFWFNLSNSLSKIGQTALEAIIPLIKNQKDESRLSTLFIQIYLANNNPLKYTSSLLDLVYKLADHISHKGNLINISTLTLNILIKSFNRSQTVENHLRLNEFYTWMIDKKLIFIDDRLPWRHFRNLLQIKLKMGDIQKVRIYIDNYIHLLPKDELHDAEVFANGLFHFYNKDYSNAQRMLYVNFKHPTYATEARFVALQARYEQGERKDLKRPLNNLIRFIQRKDVFSKEKKESVLKGAKFFKKLTNVNTKLGHQELYEKLKQSNHFYTYKWILQKCKEKL